MMGSVLVYMSKKYVLVDAQNGKDLELHVAFAGVDNDDQIVAHLPEKQVVEIYTYYRYLRIKIEIDGDVEKYLQDNNKI